MAWYDDKNKLFYIVGILMLVVLIFSVGMVGATTYRLNDYNVDINFDTAGYDVKYMPPAHSNASLFRGEYIGYMINITKGSGADMKGVDVSVLKFFESQKADPQDYSVWMRMAFAFCGIVSKHKNATIDGHPAVVIHVLRQDVDLGSVFLNSFRLKKCQNSSYRNIGWIITQQLM